jgi:phosphate:Na+ symporter
VALAHFASDWISLAMIVAVLTWLFHSSVAAILLFALLTDRGVLPDSLIVPIVLGVNLGAGAIALGLGRSLDPRGRIAPVANVLLRGGLAGGVLLASLMTPITLPAWLGAGGDALVLAHIGFNLALFALGMALAGPVSALVSRWLLPLPAVAPLRARRSALMDEDIARPAIAVQNVARELVAMGERVDTMVASVPMLFRATDEKAFAETMLLDDEVDRIHGDIKLYLARIGREACDEATEARLVRLMTAANRLEQIGDIVVHKVLARARKKHARGADFSPEGWRELNRLHEEVMESVRLSLNVMVSGDLALARALAEQKQVVRDLETDSAHRHMERIRAGLAASLETSDVHIDALYDLKEINSLLVTLAYPLLDAAGQLRATRLRKVDAAPLAS